ncbi:MAG: DUF6519 domain-containing protein, partial [Planctomycetota bacterium]
RLERVGELDDVDDIACDDFCENWIPAGTASTGRMAAQSRPDEEAASLCEVPAAGGYRGIENRLYRVEIHEGGTAGEATFKWSRDNGTVVFPVQDVATQTAGGDTHSTLKLSRLGRDRVMTIHPGDWVEVIGDETELAGRPGTLARVVPDGVDEAEQTITVAGDVSDHTDEAHLKVRRWDHVQTGEIALQDGAVELQEEQWLPLEKGVQVRFQSSGSYRTGDYWLVPARTALDDVLWPATDAGDPAYLSRHGIQHYYCPLAIVERRMETTEDGNEELVWNPLRDCRHLFPPLTRLRRGSCCYIVEPGEDVRQAVNTVIAAGGGCVCLCRGLHRVEGPLEMASAENLTVRGENPATILQFEGTNESGTGGMVISAGSRISMENMLIRGEGVPALVSVGADAEGEPSRDISLRGLRLLNPDLADEGETPTCAVRLTRVEGCSVENCSIIAQVGIEALFGEQLPFPFQFSEDLAAFPPGAFPGYTPGVRDLRLRQCTVRYRQFGAWLFKTEGCEILDCDIWPGKLGAMTDLGSIGRGEMTHRAGREHLMRAYDEAIGQPAQSKTAPGIRAFHLGYPTVAGCRLGGSAAFDAWLLRSGTVRENHVRAAERGIHAAWWHDSTCCDNRVEVNDGTGVSWAGAFRPRIDENHIRAASGLQNTPLDAAIEELVAYLDEMVRVHGNKPLEGDDEAGWQRVALWVILEDIVRVAGLGPLRSASQQVMNALGLEQIPVLYYVAYFLYPSLADPELEANWPLPVIGMRVSENDIQTEADGVALESFLSLGGIRVDANRLHSKTGKAVLAKVHRAGVNVHLLAFAWRVSIRVFLEYAMPQLRDTLAETEMPDDVREEAEDFLDVTEKTVERWGRESESFLEADCGVRGNTIRSRRTGVESNLFELAVTDNHV